MVELSNVSFAYPRKRSLFSSLDLSLGDGNIYGLLGKNGAGKTTLLRLVTGLLFPASGSATAFGYPAVRRRPEMLSDIFFVPEEFYLPPLSVKRYAATYAPFYPRYDAAVYEKCLSEFEVAAGDRLDALSYGQKKKVIISFALASGARLLLLDEPTNGLDIPSKSQFRKLLVSHFDEERSFVISTHQVRDMVNLIDPIIILDNGKIIFDHTLDEVAAHVSYRFSSQAPEPESVLYVEEAMGGYAILERNRDGRATQIDLELLFNAVMAKPDLLESRVPEGGM